MSAETFHLEFFPGGKTNKKYTATKIKREAYTFNKYVNPDSGDLWNEQCTAIHRLHPTNKSIVAVFPITVVWSQFKEWIKSNIGQDETSILVAYNGEKYDLPWLWKLTQAPHSPFSMPAKIKPFIGPCQFIGNYGSCSLNRKSNMDIYKLGVIQKYINDGDIWMGHTTSWWTPRTRLT